MNKRQHFNSVWLCTLLICALVLSGPQVSIPALAHGLSQPTAGQAEHSLVLRTEQGQFGVTYQDRQGAGHKELQAQDRQLAEEKRLAREEKLRMKNLLASRSIHLAQYAKWVKAQQGLSVARDAESFVGAPYVWGGTTPQGFDCSGFTQYVFAQHGVAVPRNSYDQFDAGRPVAEQELQPGDLVFFTTYAPGPSHLGIYVGEGKFVHALNNNTGVITSTLDNDYYKNRFLGAKRVI
ncbi:NlpC/P60 family protein [Tumebacillus sp. BK434]|uniref:C40 family peptidase n=1 Tax=Tumebacillus sp. BK434 TaxID=2512169 RepID=UPI0010E16766|nr:C40 family peptidase [Tumebacillus sp. BK434]TCP59459.1 NlpC/P60 family protein [Tumebacillus sp. BK434]